MTCIRIDQKELVFKLKPVFSSQYATHSLKSSYCIETNFSYLPGTITHVRIYMLKLKIHSSCPLIKVNLSSMKSVGTILFKIYHGQMWRRSQLQTTHFFVNHKAFHIFLISVQKHMLQVLIRSALALLMSTFNIYFCGEIRKILF